MSKYHNIRVKKNINTLRYEDGTPLAVGDDVIYTVLENGGVQEYKGTIIEDVISYQTVRTSTGTFNINPYPLNGGQLIYDGGGHYEIKRMYFKRA